MRYILLFLLCMSTVSALQIAIDQPDDITTRESVSISYTVTNDGPELQDCAIRTYPNGRLYSTCRDRCGGLGDGFAAGETIEQGYSDTARRLDYLKLGDNEFTVKVECAGESAEESVHFTVTEATLPTVDLELSNLEVEVEDTTVQSLKFTVTNVGDVDLVDDTVSYTIVMENPSGTRVGGSGAFLDYRDDTLAAGESEVVEFPNVEYLSLRADEVEVTVQLDDMNGLEEYELAEESSVSEMIVLDTEPVSEGYEALWMTLHPGWNLVWGLRQGDAVYGLRSGKYYVADASSPVESGYWVYSHERETVRYAVPSSSPSIALEKGWSMIGIAPAMVGQTLGAYLSSCSVARLYAFSEGEYSKDLAADETMEHPLSEDSVGLGLLVKVDDPCMFERPAVAPPELPE
ncbi:MAG: hypothetical protein ACOCWQ_04770 [Nanoarchaeota archaeon]